MSSSGVIPVGAVASVEGQTGVVDLGGAAVDGDPIKWDNAAKLFRDARPDLNAAYLSAVLPVAHGVNGDGTDESAAIQAMLNAVGGAGKAVCIWLDPTKTYRADSALTHPGGYIAFRSLGGPVAPQSTATITAGPVLDLRATGYRLQCLQYGVLDIDNVQIVNGGTNAGTFILCTLARPVIGANVVFQGRAAVSGATCDEDAVQIGGTDTTVTAGVTTSAYGSFGGRLGAYTCSRIRRGAYLRNFADTIIVDGPLANGDCGAPASGATTPAFIEIDPGTGASHFANGCVLRGHLIEMGHYVYGVALRGNTGATHVGPGGYWDAGGSAVADVRIDSTATYNTIDTSGFSSCPAHVDDASGNNVTAGARPRVFVNAANISSTTTASYTTVFTTGSVVASSRSMYVEITGTSSISVGGAVALFQIGNGTTNLPAGTLTTPAGGSQASHAMGVLFTGLTLGQAYTFTVQVEMGSAATWNCRTASFPSNEQMVVKVTPVN